MRYRGVAAAVEVSRQRHSLARIFIVFLFHCLRFVCATSSCCFVFWRVIFTILFCFVMLCFALRLLLCPIYCIFFNSLPFRVFCVCCVLTRIARVCSFYVRFSCTNIPSVFVRVLCACFEQFYCVFCLHGFLRLCLRAFRSRGDASLFTPVPFFYFFFLNGRRLSGQGEVVDDTAVFDSNCITPGTEFMAKVSRHLRWPYMRLSLSLLFLGVVVVARILDRAEHYYYRYCCFAIGLSTTINRGRTEH